MTNPRPQYTEALLVRLIRETATMEELTDLCKLYMDLEMQNDIIITLKVKAEVGLQQQTIIYGGDTLGKTPGVS